MALSFIGGILAGIDPQASTIQLSNVYSMGTEQRRPPNQFIAPVPDPYAYIIFRASEVKDLSVDEPPATQHNVHDDPAVLGAGGPAKPYSPYPAPQHPANGATPIPQGQPQSYAATAQANQPAPVVPAPQSSQQPTASQPPPSAARPPATAANGNTRRPNPVHTAAASLETVERALGDLRVSSANANTTHSTRGGDVELKVPTTEFDFESANAKFDKSAIGTPTARRRRAEKAADKVETAYNPQKSFFDSLSSSSANAASGSAGGQGRRGRGGAAGGGRNRREEEREKNVATFGEPGGVGLLGPGSYVGGWGGYGRRGGRPRRGGGGGGRGGGNGAPPVVQARG
ncbi:Scd6-like Sm domain-containing protein [Gymnopilus junonius]|uniref:Scd6-like Sm domain-containing protein n=1 Tax=Gymnopilus junonius TaxID=109634 RepID=A0A9P5TU94_GYMJU|nr:Scd6-like Sm domain-containing protein [Gymnopilus junonius]